MRRTVLVSLFNQTSLWSNVQVFAVSALCFFMNNLFRLTSAFARPGMSVQSVIYQVGLIFAHTVCPKRRVGYFESVFLFRFFESFSLSGCSAEVGTGYICNYTPELEELGCPLLRSSLWCFGFSSQSTMTCLFCWSNIIVKQRAGESVFFSSNLFRPKQVWVSCTAHLNDRLVLKRRVGCFETSYLSPKWVSVFSGHGHYY